LLGGGALAITYFLVKKQKDSKNGNHNEVLPKARRPSTLFPRIVKNDLPNTLENTTIRLIDIPMRKYQLVGDKRKKFLDEWIAEDDGVESIKAMYKKRPSAFSKEDIAYLKSREIILA
jgi:hypothetical protein